MTARKPTPRPLPGLWRERGDDVLLVLLDQPVDVEGMVMVARLGSDWRRRPALRWRTWAEDLVSATPPGSATAQRPKVPAAPAARAYALSPAHAEPRDDGAMNTDRDGIGVGIS